MSVQARNYTAMGKQSLHLMFLLQAANVTTVSSLIFTDF
jgi:hypothetical protein